MLGPVMIAILFSLLSRWVSLVINIPSPSIFSTTGCLPLTMSITPRSLIFGRQYLFRSATCASEERASSSAITFAVFCILSIFAASVSLTSQNRSYSSENSFSSELRILSSNSLRASVVYLSAFVSVCLRI